MAKVKIYRASFYDISSDGWTRSRRWFTRAGAEKVNAELDESSEVEIDEADLEEAGWWTARDYRPNATGGFQTRVRTG
jgi:hypothetical protein